MPLEYILLLDISRRSGIGHNFTMYFHMQYEISGPSAPARYGRERYQTSLAAIDRGKHGFYRE